MCNDSIGVVLCIERVHQERLIWHSLLNGLDNLIEDLLSCINKDFIQMLLLADLLQQLAQRLDPGKLLLHLEDVPQIKQVLKITKSHRCRRRQRQSVCQSRALTSPATIAVALHDSRKRMCDGKGLRYIARVSANAPHKA